MSAGPARPLLRPTCAPARPAARPPGRGPTQPGTPPGRPSAGRGRRLGHARRGPHAGGSPGRAHGQSAGPRPRAAGPLTSAAARSAPTRPAPESPRPVPNAPPSGNQVRAGQPQQVSWTLQRHPTGCAHPPVQSTLAGANDQAGETDDRPLSLARGYASPHPVYPTLSSPASAPPGLRNRAYSCPVSWPRAE